MIDAYEESTEYTVLPLENTIYGPVTETLDCFFSRFNPNPSSTSSSSSGMNLEGSSEIQKSIKRKGKGKEKEIIATLDLPIRHCLVVKRGTKMEDITIVSSHEQVSSTLPFPLLFARTSLLGKTMR
jgi:prephenate dehydratase